MEPYLAALLIVAAAFLSGQAILTLCGFRGWSWLAPGVGLAAILVLAAAAVKLPGDAAVALVLLLLALAGSAVVLWRSELRLRLPAWDGVAAGLAAAALTAVPFVAKGRIGLQGMSLNNDTAVHLIWAESLKSDLIASLYGVPSGYPIGPHSLMAALSIGTGMDVDTAMIGLLIAVPVVTVLVAIQGFAGAPRGPRAVGAVLVGFSYMLVAWYAQGAFKELLHALFLVTFALVLREVIAAPAGRRVRMAMPLGLLVAGGIQTYSYLAVAWYAAALGVAAVLLVAVRPSRVRTLVRDARTAIVPAAAGVLVFVLAIAPEIPRILSYFREIGVSPAGTATGIATSNIGNLAGPLPLEEALNVWPTGDFRFPPVANAIGSLELLQTLALVAVVFGVLWSLRRRDVAVPATLIGALGVYFISNDRQSAYVTAKALVVLSPLFALVMFQPLVAALRPSRDRIAVLRVAAAGLAIVVLGVATGRSSLLMLRATPVESTAHRDQLDQLRTRVQGQDVIFLGVDDYAAWRLRGTRAAYGGVGTPSAIPLALDERKSWSYGNPYDFDNVRSSELDRFRYVITTRTPYQSAPPPNFHLVTQTQLYELWERRGATPDKTPAETESAVPGKATSCRGRSRGRGLATVWPTKPVVAHISDGLSTPGTQIPVAFTLPTGTWDLSIQYISEVPLRISAEGRSYELPANTGRPGPWWAAGRVHSKGMVALTIIPEIQSRFTYPTDGAIISNIAAVPVAPKRDVSGPAACGRYIDHTRDG